MFAKFKIYKLSIRFHFGFIRQAHEELPYRVVSEKLEHVLRVIRGTITIFDYISLHRPIAVSRKVAT